MAYTPKTLRRIVPLLRHELRSASSCNLYSAEHTSRSSVPRKKCYAKSCRRSSSFDQQSQDEDEDSSTFQSQYAGMSLGAAVAFFAMTSDRVKAEGPNDEQSKTSTSGFISDEGANVVTQNGEQRSKRVKKKKKLPSVLGESNSQGALSTSSSEVDESSETDEKDEEENGKKESKKERVGFRDRKIIDYENRIRAYSTPDKIFRYFATYKSTVDNEIYMTPGDFLRSLTPGVKQPDGLGLDQFKKFDPETLKTSNYLETENIEESSIFHHLGCSGLISFSDYVFLLTILSTSKRQFEIAFRMFDLNGDGDVDAEEFAQVQNIIRQTTSVGSRHRDHSTTGSTLKKEMNSALSVYFFGENLDGKLTIERFLAFQEQLQREILTLEFSRKSAIDSEGNRISEKDFADLLLTYADYTPKKRSAVFKRVKKKYPSKSETLGVTLEDYIDIFSVLIHIDDVDKALYFYNLAGASIDPSTLQHVGKVCANVQLSDHVVEVIFTIFDEDGDGALSNKEFVAVMKNKLKRGLEKPKDTGLTNLVAAFAQCAKVGVTPKTAAEVSGMN